MVLSQKNRNNSNSNFHLENWGVGFSYFPIWELILKWFYTSRTSEKEEHNSNFTKPTNKIIILNQASISVHCTSSQPCIPWYQLWTSSFCPPGCPLTAQGQVPSAGDSSAFWPSGASDPVASSFSRNPSGKLTFCCFRNSCHCTYLPHHPLWYQALFFSRNLPFYQWPAHSQVPTSYLKILGESTLLTENKHPRHKGGFSPDPQSMFVRGLVIILQLNWLQLPPKSTVCKGKHKNCFVVRYNKPLAALLLKVCIISYGVHALPASFNRFCTTIL